MLVSVGNFVGNAQGGGFKNLTFPVGFSWIPDFNISYNNVTAKSNYTYDRPTTAQTLYIDPVNGDDANDGTSWALAKHSFAGTGGLEDTISGAATIYCRPGYYPREDAPSSGFNPSSDIAIIGVGGLAVFQRCEEDHHPFNWVDNSNGTYTGDRTAVDMVLDWQELNDDGLPAFYKRVSSVAEVEAEELTWYETGGDITIHRRNGAAPDSDIKVFLGETGTIDCTNDIVIYLENVEFWGGKTAFRFNPSGAANTASLTAINCAARYSQYVSEGNGEGDGWDLDDLEYVYMKNCEATDNYKDGFNVHCSERTVPTRYLEENCRSRRNGWKNRTDYAGNPTATNDENGSSVHDGTEVIRLGCVHQESWGHIIADVDEKTMSLNVSCRAETSNSSSKGAFLISNGTMWLVNCKGTGAFRSRVISNAGVMKSGGTFTGDAPDSGTVTDFTVNEYNLAVEAALHSYVRPEVSRRTYTLGDVSAIEGYGPEYSVAGTNLKIDEYLHRGAADSVLYGPDNSHANIYSVGFVAEWDASDTGDMMCLGYDTTPAGSARRRLRIAAGDVFYNDKDDGGANSQEISDDTERTKAAIVVIWDSATTVTIYINGSVAIDPNDSNNPIENMPVDSISGVDNLFFFSRSVSAASAPAGLKLYDFWDYIGEIDTDKIAAWSEQMVTTHGL